MQKVLFSLLLACFSISSLAAQTEEAKEIFDVEMAPSFPGGEAAMLKYLSENIKYPAIAKESGIQGRVILTFVVEKDGSVSDVKILREPGGGCGKEAVRVVQGMPKWAPGETSGKPVRVKYTLPILFSLGDDESAVVHDLLWVDNAPIFPGGKTAMDDFFKKNLKMPTAAKKKKLSGEVSVMVILNADGSVFNAVALDDLGSGCAEEAVRLVKSMPKWSPARLEGKPVAVRFLLSVPIAEK